MLIAQETSKKGKQEENKNKEEEMVEGLGVKPSVNRRYTPVLISRTQMKMGSPANIVGK